MDTRPSPEPENSKSIITVQQYSREVKKSRSLPPLSEEQKQRASELAQALIRSEDRLDDIVLFGSDSQAAVALVTREMLAGVRVGMLDEVIQLSDGILSELQTLHIDDLSPAARRILLVFRETTADIENRIKNFFRKYEQVNTRLDRQEADIFAREAASTERYYKDAELARAAFGALLDARLRQAAIMIFLDSEYGYAELSRRQQAVSEERETASRENRSLDFSIISSADHYAKYIERLDGKFTALQQVIVSSYQLGITIRMMSDNENIIRQKLSDIRTELLPQWRMLIAIAYQAYQQQGIARFVQQLAAAESQLRKQTAERLEQAADGVADLMTRPVFDVESMQYYNEKLVSSLDILKTASLEAKKIRDAAEGEMLGLINQLGDAVAATSMREG